MKEAAIHILLIVFQAAGGAQSTATAEYSSYVKCELAGNAAVSKCGGWGSACSRASYSCSPK